MSTAIKMLQNLVLPLLFIFCLHSLPTLIQGNQHDQRKPYIVYMGELPVAKTYAVEDHHHNMLATAIGDKRMARESKIHSYRKSFNGFVARLLPHEAEKLQEEDNVVSVFPNTYRKLHTTRSWDYLGMPLKVERRSNIESHIIVGVLDTGIWIDCPSFNDEGYGPPPRRWKGKCMTGANFTHCNNKVIGAKYFNLDKEGEAVENPSPTDDQGHGTHTASTAAGVAVKDASLYGIGKGTARGGVPSARVAMYKVCWSIGCSDMDMLAGFDEAIADGVNFISVSIGGPSRDFFSDPIAIGAFHAMRRGVLTSCSAGNDGPQPMTVENVAPWILTVAASSIDRQFTTTVNFGDGKNAIGLSINTFAPEKKMYPLINGALAANITGDNDFFGSASSCDYGTLSKDKVVGRIVYCTGGMGSQDQTIHEYGGAGVIIGLEEEIDASYTTIIPGTFVDANKVGKNIDLYINTTKNAQAIIQKTETRRVPAPFVASFSSRGPQVITPNILKPDLTAPGLDILAAYSKMVSLTGYTEDTRFDVFNILSGTSMACPHATAAAAYVKSFHPDWSPAAIKSALMTTATPIRDNLAELATGSGQIDPVKAVHPGLVYDISVNSYIAFLCKQGYNSTNIGILIGTKGFNCATIKPPPGSDGINYPSMHIQLENTDSSISAEFYRTVTNVGYGSSTYKAKVIAPKGLSVEVIPDTLQFNGLHQDHTFKVVLKGPPMSEETMLLSALLEWSDSRHSVRSPILVFKFPSY
ncbi:PREDICTED: subtilisin-like protease SBT4.15 [Lupinus angustifolius]|nr:PREDICTED: subtilisin-like protease SBT4.15 [Lupinus angustifolius]